MGGGGDLYVPCVLPAAALVDIQPLCCSSFHILHFLHDLLMMLSSLQCVVLGALTLSGKYEIQIAVKEIITNLSVNKNIKPPLRTGNGLKVFGKTNSSVSETPTDDAHSKPSERRRKSRRRLEEFLE